MSIIFGILTTLLVLFCLAVIGWQVFIGLMSGVVFIAGGAWAVLLATIALACAGIFALFFFAGLAVFLTMAFIAVWMLVAIIFFPVLLPILLPLLVILLIMGLARRQKNKIKN